MVSYSAVRGASTPKSRFMVRLSRSGQPIFKILRNVNVYQTCLEEQSTHFPIGWLPQVIDVGEIHIQIAFTISHKSRVRGALRKGSVKAILSTEVERVPKRIDLRRSLFLSSLSRSAKTECSASLEPKPKPSWSRLMK